MARPMPDAAPVTTNVRERARSLTSVTASPFLESGGTSRPSDWDHRRPVNHARMVESEIAEQLPILTLSYSLTGLGTARLTELLGRGIVARNLEAAAERSVTISNSSTRDEHVSARNGYRSLS